MGKKKGKKKRKQKKYNKNQFIDIVCKQCTMCDGTYNPVFCWGEMYKCAPNKFMGYCYGQLLKTSDSFRKIGVRSILININEFGSIFCDSGICGNDIEGCPNRCFSSFKGQLLGHGSVSALKGKKKKKKKEKFICQPYPTFISSEGMAKDIEKIINDTDS